MTIAERLARLDWPALEAGLWERGWASTPAVLTREECDDLVRLYADDALFRSRVDMERHRFGVGDYKYFARPLPALVEQLRVHAYPRLAGIASSWMEALGTSDRFPPTLAAFLARCAKAGQHKPTPLLLHYEATARPIGGGGDRGGAGRPARLHQPLPARAWRPRVLPRERAARREPGPLRPAPYARHHLPRRPMSQSESSHARRAPTD